MKSKKRIPALGCLTAITVATFVPSMAFGHGSLSSPPSRIYLGWQDNIQNPENAAIAAAVALGGTQPFYDWNEVVNFHPGTPDFQRTIDYSLSISDGRLASADNDKYAGLDLVRDDWPTTPIESGPFTLEWFATTPHNPNVFRAYITTPDWDPSQPLEWAKMEELPVGAVTLEENVYKIPTVLPDRSGRHAIYVIWQRLDPVGEGFYALSDVDFGSCDAACKCPADLDGDGSVGGGDLGLMLAAWGTADGDLNGDGQTNGADLGIALSSWGSCRPDCDGNGVSDEDEIAAGAADCDGNGIPDACGFDDCDGDGVPDACAVIDGSVDDCNGNGLPDACDLAEGDLDGNGQLDACEISGITHSWRVVDSWPGNFIAEITLTNGSEECLYGWELGFHLHNTTIDSVWNGVLLESDGHNVLIGNETWNVDFCPGDSVTIGMSCQGMGMEPPGFMINGSPTEPAP